MIWKLFFWCRVEAQACSVNLGNINTVFSLHVRSVNVEASQGFAHGEAKFELLFIQQLFTGSAEIQSLSAE